jgi:adenine-specific DNA-methyltransferase
MNNIDGQTHDITADRVEELRAIFPEVFKDGKIDFDTLQNLLGKYVDDAREKYSFTWAGKLDAVRLAQKRSTGTLRPCKEESVDFDTTENLYIEGDNLEVLKLVSGSYMNQVKMIYIDPPYNTGNDFVYADDFSDSIANYKRVIGEAAKSNAETAGRYHTNWLNMMLPRLKLARVLLKPDGAIFISIDDNEVVNLRKICDEVFGEYNFLATIVWQKKYAATNDAKGFSTTHDYIVVYQKSDAFKRNLLPRTADQNAPYAHDDNDGKGLWRSDNLLVKSFSQSGVYPIKNPNTGKEYLPPNGSCWRASQETMQTWLGENRIYFGKDGNGAPQLKRYLNEVQQGRVPQTWWTFEEAGHNDAANKEVAELFQSKTPFDTPKPTKLISLMLQIATHKNDIILDFFSGSGTTAHAVMQLNAEDGGRRKFICVQIPSPPDDKSEAYKAGYKNICEIGKERICRAGKKIKKDMPTLAAELDTGFKVFKLDTSNLKKWNNAYTRDYADLANRIREHYDYLTPDRSPLDMVYEIMLKYGLPLTLPITEQTVAGAKAHIVTNLGNESVDAYKVLVCLQERLTIEQMEALSALGAGTLFFADRCFTDTNAMTNCDEILKKAGQEMRLF